VSGPARWQRRASHLRRGACRQPHDSGRRATGSSSARLRRVKRTTTSPARRPVPALLGRLSRCGPRAILLQGTTGLAGAARVLGARTRSLTPVGCGLWQTKPRVGQRPVDEREELRRLRQRQPANTYSLSEWWVSSGFGRRRRSAIWNASTTRVARRWVAIDQPTMRRRRRGASGRGLDPPPRYAASPSRRPAGSPPRAARGGPEAVPGATARR
jgi:hypothetical protein